MGGYGRRFNEAGRAALCGATDVSHCMLLPAGARGQTCAHGFPPSQQFPPLQASVQTAAAS
jgi:hypothetical protein